MSERGEDEIRPFDELLVRTVEADDDESEADIVALPIAGPAFGEGEVLQGRYRVERVLARGGVGVVVRAIDQRLDRTVAIKLLLPQFANVPKARARFELEAKVAAKIDSEHIPRVIDVGELSDGAQFIVMEYLVGEELSRLLGRRKKLPIDEAVELSLQICRVLALAHAAGFVHRDLKPGNVFLTHRTDGSPCVKVLDFGVAKAQGLGRALGDGAAAPSAASSIVGTPRYMAPEQVAAAPVDERADIWALGAIVFEMLAGRQLFSGTRITDIFDDIKHARLPRLEEHLTGESAAMCGVLQKCFAKDPSDRYASVADLAKAIAAVRPTRGEKHVEHAQKALEKRDGQRGRPRDGEAAQGRSRATLLFVGASVAVLALVALAFVWSRRAERAVDAVDAGKLGLSCESEATCGGLSCMDGMCTKSCAHNAACPAGARCTSDGVCAKPLRVGFVYVGVPEDEGWTGTHDRGRRDAGSRLPWLETDFVSDAHQPGVAEKAIDDFVAGGCEVIVANSFSLREAVAKKAKQYPETKFVAYSYPPAEGVGAFGGRLEQAWFLAGFAAAQKSKTGRLGFVGSLVTPEVVRYIAAFTLGARRRDPRIVVEVRWIGFWFDTGPADDRGRHKEELLTEQLLSTGCDVIAHNADNGRVVEAVEASGRAAFSIANNNPRGCEKGKKTCLGAVAWNWGPLYASIFDDIHRGKWSAATRYFSSIRANADQSAVNFVMNPEVAGSKVALEVAPVLAELANDATGTRVFEGPFCSTGQRASCVAKGVTLGEEELRTMCFYVEGVVEKVDAADPASADRPAVVPQPACSQQQ